MSDGTPYVKTQLKETVEIEVCKRLIVDLMRLCWEAVVQSGKKMDVKMMMMTQLKAVTIN